MQQLILIDIEELRQVVMQCVELAISNHLPQTYHEDPELMNVKQASKFLHVSPQTLYNKISRGEIEPIKKGKRIYFEKGYLVEWVKGGNPKLDAKKGVSDFLNQFKRHQN